MFWFQKLICLWLRDETHLIGEQWSYADNSLLLCGRSWRKIFLAVVSWSAGDYSPVWCWLNNSDIHCKIKHELGCFECLSKNFSIASSSLLEANLPVGMKFSNVIIPHPLFSLVTFPFFFFYSFALFVLQLRGYLHETGTNSDQHEFVSTSIHFFLCVYMRPAWQWTQTGLTLSRLLDRDEKFSYRSEFVPFPRKWQQISDRVSDIFIWQNMSFCPETRHQAFRPGFM